MMQSYDPSEASSRWEFEPAGVAPLNVEGIQPTLIANCAPRAWDERWDVWARSAIASGALVPPQHESVPRYNGVILAVSCAVGMLGFAGWLFWGFSH